VNDDTSRIEPALKRIESLVAMILVRQMVEDTQQERILALSRAGLTNPEIARLVGTTSAVVSQQLYSAKSGAPKKRKTIRRGQS
jgi:transcriptional regulator